MASAKGLWFPLQGRRGTSLGQLGSRGDGGEETGEDVPRGLLSLHFSFLHGFENVFTVSELKPASCNKLNDLKREWGVLGLI